MTWSWEYSVNVLLVHVKYYCILNQLSTSSSEIGTAWFYMISSISFIRVSNVSEYSDKGLGSDDHNQVCLFKTCWTMIPAASWWAIHNLISVNLLVSPELFVPANTVSLVLIFSRFYVWLNWDIVLLIAIYYHWYIIGLTRSIDHLCNQKPRRHSPIVMATKTDVD
jgi:hypothetical protein